jgi:hypothetical protein
MKKHIIIAKPALTAIAAGLALGSTPALAQVADPATSPAPQPQIVVPSAQPSAPALPGAPVTLPQITVPAPPATAQAAPAPVVAPPLPTVEPQARTAAQSEPAPQPRTETARAETARAEPRAASAERMERAAPATPRAETPAPTIERAAPASDLLNEPAPSPTDLRTGEPGVLASEPAADANPVAPEIAATQDQTALWVMGAGGAALLLGAGAVVFLRRRDRREDAVDERYGTAPAMTAREPETVAAEPVLPVRQPEPASPAAVHAVAATPTAADEGHVEEAYVPTGPGAWAPASIATASPALARGSFAERFPEIEAMAAAAPSPENPFRTRTKRLRRAAFLHEHGQLQQRPAVASTPAETTVSASKPERQPVYNFGATPTYRPKNWKPITT